MLTMAEYKEGQTDAKSLLVSNKQIEESSQSRLSKSILVYAEVVFWSWDN